jgi:Resolvase, N terminal domain
LCRAHAAKNGLDVVGTYDDRASSGASIFGRDGLIRLMDAARDGAFDVSLSRRWIACRAISSNDGNDDFASPKDRAYFMQRF